MDSDAVVFYVLSVVVHPYEEAKVIILSIVLASDFFSSAVKVVFPVENLSKITFSLAIVASSFTAGSDKPANKSKAD